jgi:hypothetical protein
LKVFIRVTKYQLVPAVTMIYRITTVIGRSDSDYTICKRWGYMGLIESKTGQRMQNLDLGTVKERIQTSDQTDKIAVIAVRITFDPV